MPTASDSSNMTTQIPSLPNADAPTVKAPVVRVLIVESDITTADVLVEALEGAGYGVEVATEASYGLLLAESYAPHLFLIGSDAQRLNALDLTQSLRNAPHFGARFRDTPIIYIGNANGLIQQRFHALPGTPMSAYIFKPIDERELLEIVARALSLAEH